MTADIVGLGYGNQEARIAAQKPLTAKGLDSKDNASGRDTAVDMSSCPILA